MMNDESLDVDAFLLYFENFMVNSNSHFENFKKPNKRFGLNLSSDGKSLDKTTPK